MERAPQKLHPLMTVTALAVTVASLATIVVITGALPERGEDSTATRGAAAATFATRLAAEPLADARNGSGCSGCATVVSIRPADAGGKSWLVTVRMADGSHRLLSAEGQPPWQAGERVRISNGFIMAM